MNWQGDTIQLITYRNNETIGQHLPHGTIHWNEDSFTSMTFSSKIHNLNLIMIKHQKNPNWRTFYKTTDLHSKISSLWNTRTKELRNSVRRLTRYITESNKWCQIGSWADKRNNWQNLNKAHQLDNSIMSISWFYWLCHSFRRKCP